MAANNRKRSHSNITELRSVPRKRQPKRGHRRDASTSSSLLEQPTDTPIFTTPANPQATLCGLPAELRLQIYSHLCDTTLVHVHFHDDVADDDEDVFGDRWLGEEEQIRFTWTPCRATSTVSPFLCANPKWSGLCEEKNRCTHKLDSPPEHNGFFGLAATCKSIRNEAQEFFLSETAFSIEPRHLLLWFDYLEGNDPSRLDSLKRLTLAGSNSYRYVNKHLFDEVRQRLPGLEAFGFQCQDYTSLWCDSRGGDSTFDDDCIRIRCRNWMVSWWSEWMRDFDDAIDVAFEFMVLRRRRQAIVNTVEQQVAVRIVRKGKRTKDGAKLGSTLPWKYEDVRIEIDNPGQLAAPERNAGWRQWWRGEARRLLI